MEKVNKSFLEKRGSTYWYRRLVPTSLHDAVERKEIRHSLRTKDYEEACTRQHARDVELDAEWARLLANGGVTELTDADRDALTAQWVAEALALDMDDRALGRGSSYATGPDDDIDDVLSDFIAEVRRGIGEGAPDSYGIGANAARSAIREHRLRIEEGSHEFKRLTFAFMCAAVRLFETLIARNAGRMEEPPTPPALALPALTIAPSTQAPSRPDPATNPQVAHTLDDLFRHWEKQTQPRPKTVIEARAAVRDLLAANNLDSIAPSAVTHRHVRAYRDAMANAGAVAATAKKKLGLLSGMFSIAADDCLFGVESNPTHRVKARGKESESRPVWPVRQLNQLFAASESLAAGAYDSAKVGSAAAYWLPLLALFTGARLSELCQLYVTDIQTDEDVTFIRFTDSGEGRHLKTGGEGRKRVPIHRSLVGLGFLELVEQARSRKQLQLFPELKPDPRGVWGAAASPWFGRVRRGVFGEGADVPDFHSFRHTFKHYARAAGIPEDQHDALTGHKNASVSRNYGGAEKYPIQPLAASIDRFSVPGLVLPPPYFSLPSRRL